MGVDTFFIIAVLIISIIIHEVAHGYAADALGDPTARLQGRLTLNPLPHVDLLGSIIIPGLLVLTGANILFGWAKPVPYNPYNLRNQRFGEAMVAAAGPLTNIAIAVVFGLLIRFGLLGGFISAPFATFAGIIVYTNILLACFNLIPFPPLDGSRILKSLLPYRMGRYFESIERLSATYGLLATFLFLIIFMNLLWPFFMSFLMFLFALLTGIPVSSLL